MSCGNHLQHVLFSLRDYRFRDTPFARCLQCSDVYGLQHYRVSTYPFGHRSKFGTPNSIVLHNRGIYLSRLRLRWLSYLSQVSYRISQHLPSWELWLASLPRSSITNPPASWRGCRAFLQNFSSSLGLLVVSSPWYLSPATGFQATTK